MTVTFYGCALEYTGLKKSLELDEPCSNVGAMIEILGRLYGDAFKELLLAGEKWIILVNGSGLMYSGGLNTPLQSTDRIDVLPFAQAG